MDGLPTDPAHTRVVALRNAVATARQLCGCISCCGLREIGAHTIAGNKPRSTPSSCVAAALVPLIAEQAG